jgi:hypothetical protein
LTISNKKLKNSLLLKVYGNPAAIWLSIVAWYDDYYDPVCPALQGDINVFTGLAIVPYPFGRNVAST